MVILGRAMGIEPIENPDLTKYADAAQVVSNNLLSQLVYALSLSTRISFMLTPHSRETA